MVAPNFSIILFFWVVTRTCSRAMDTGVGIISGRAGTHHPTSLVRSGSKTIWSSNRDWSTRIAPLYWATCFRRKYASIGGSPGRLVCSFPPPHCGPEVVSQGARLLLPVAAWNACWPCHHQAYFHAAERKLYPSQEPKGNRISTGWKWEWIREVSLGYQG